MARLGPLGNPPTLTERQFPQRNGENEDDGLNGHHVKSGDNPEVGQESWLHLAEGETEAQRGYVLYRSHEPRHGESGT